MTRRAFTLIELLIVVSMIAILASIAVPNFLEAQVRSKTARVAIDMSATEAGLHAYYADHRGYPPSRPAVVELMSQAWAFDDRDGEEASSIDQEPTTATLANEPSGWGRNYHREPASPFWQIDEGRRDAFRESGWDMAALTTPVSYVLSRVLPDPFSDTRGAPFVYYNALQGAPEIRKQSNYPRYVLLSYGPDTDQFAPSDLANPMRGPFIPYDPTNGTVSQGDIFRDGLH